MPTEMRIKSAGGACFSRGAAGTLLCDIRQESLYKIRHSSKIKIAYDNPLPFDLGLNDFRQNCFD